MRVLAKATMTLIVLVLLSTVTVSQALDDAVAVETPEREPDGRSR